MQTGGCIFHRRLTPLKYGKLNPEVEMAAMMMARALPGSDLYSRDRHPRLSFLAIEAHPVSSKFDFTI